jgi:hypothetical protein
MHAGQLCSTQNSNHLLQWFMAVQLSPRRRGRTDHAVSGAIRVLDDRLIG